MPRVSNVLSSSTPHTGGRLLEYEGCTPHETIIKLKHSITALNERIAELELELVRRDVIIKRFRQTLHGVKSSD